MGLFLHKLNPLTEFSISLGPVYIERLIESSLIKNGSSDIGRLSGVEKIQGYIDFLNGRTKKLNKKESLFVDYFKGFFYQQMAERSTEIDNKEKYQEEALAHYQAYLKLAKGTEESRYYSQWQVGRLQDQFNYPWSIVKDSLLKANAIDPIRGESINDLIIHYTSISDWANAYTYSKFTIVHFFSRNPIAKRRWYVDPDSYNGNVLDTHITICRHLNYWSEAETTYRQLLNYVVEHIHEFQKIKKPLLQIVEQMYSDRIIDKMYTPG
ncbi:MAG TPA: hypothetical protein VK588_06965 [Chitinophagaceae bacterium]|nr:hypothetical protein [Chitinophagaceae bacterium]